MKDMIKNRILVTEILLWIIAIVLIVIFEYNLQINNWDKFFVDITTSILLAITAGLSVGIFFEFFVRNQQKDEILQLVNVSKDLDYSEISEYHQEFKELGIGNFIKDAKNIDIYLAYGGTLFNQINHILLESFKDKTKKINIYLLATNNPFVIGYGNLWGKIDPDYNEEGLKKKITSSINTLSRIADTAKESKEYAEINICEIKNNPINFSFYKCDEKIIFCPTKITERKEAQVPSLILTNKNNSGGLYNWVLGELEHIKKSESTKVVYPQIAESRG